MKTPRKLIARDDRVTIDHEFSSVDQFITDYVANISRSGVFIRSQKPLPIGSKVNLKFTVNVEGPEVIEGVGEVVRLQDDPPGMGVVFVELTSHSQALVTKLITRRQVPQGRPRRTTAPPPAPTPPASSGRKK
jgi:uncharacterized protein (TIGR02266 family)